MTCVLHVQPNSSYITYNIQAASSLDPTFWPVHPTIERLWMFKRLTGTMTDLTWGDRDITVSTDDEGGSGNSSTYVEALSLFDESCNGHRGSDIYPFDLVTNETDFKASN